MPNLDAAFSAMADPTRRAILARLALGETTVMELAEPFEMTQPPRPFPRSMHGSTCCVTPSPKITPGSTTSWPA
jgi:DNA-binding transcriptional ArsR family regulator